MHARERLWLTADRKRVVPEGHTEASTLYAAEGDELPESAASLFGIADGHAPRGQKRRKGGEDKSREGGEDKSGEQGGKTLQFGGDHTQREGSSGTAREAPSTGSGTSAETSNVGVQPGSQVADDLSEIKGIGPASARKLADAGISTFAALAAIDPANPPQIAGLGVNPDWESWVTQAAAMAAPAQQEA